MQNSASSDRLMLSDVFGVAHAREVLLLARARQSQFSFAKWIPDERQIAAVASLLYEASVQTEEGRAPRCSVVIEEYYLPELWTAGGKVVAFDPHLPLNVKNLVYLATAFAEPNARLVVVAQEKAGTPKSIVAAVVSQGTRLVHSDRTQMGGRSRRRRRLPDLEISIEGPAHLRFSLGSIEVARFAHGKLVGYSSSQTPVRFQDHFFGVCARELVATTFPHFRGDAHEELVEIVAKRMSDFAEGVSERLVSLKHGGIVVFLGPSVKASAIVGTKKLLRPKVRSKGALDERAFESIRQSCGLYNLVKHQARGAVEGQHMEDEWSGDDSQSPIRGLSTAASGLRLIADSWANYASVDGAVVADSNFNVMCFGAFVTGADAPATVYQVVAGKGGRNQFSAQPSDARGTRHLAAFRVANRVLDAIVLVVSQDGSLSWVTRLTRRVVYWNSRP
ncbi:MAG: hypothetical protein KF754_12120 [Planctomycetes bacterium]|nr:hypothetical protein [Planctomycetota bacterium]